MACVVCTKMQAKLGLELRLAVKTVSLLLHMPCVL